MSVTTVCGWCGAELSAGDGMAISHGICESCADDHFSESVHGIETDSDWCPLSGRKLGAVGKRAATMGIEYTCVGCGRRFRPVVFGPGDVRAPQHRSRIG